MRFPIRWRLLLAIGLPILAVYVIVIVGVLLALQRAAIASVEKDMTETAARYADALDGAMRELAQVARSTAVALEANDWPTRERLADLLRANVERTPLCFGAAIAFEPYAYDRDTELLCPYVYRDGTTLRTIDIATEAYRYTDPEWEWYAEPRRTGQPDWTAPYFDEGAGGILMSTFSAPFFRDGALAGVTTVDIALEPLERAIRKSFPSDLDIFVITESGQYVVHRDRDRIMTSNLLDEAAASGREDLQALGRAMTAQRIGLATIETEDGDAWVFHAPVTAPRWSIGATVSRRHALEEVHDQIKWLSGILAATLLLAAFLIWLVSGRLTRPLIRLRDTVREIASGNLDCRTPDGARTDEVGDLARSVDVMRGDLKNLIRTRADEQASSRNAIIFSLAKLAESRDDDTGQHLDRICRYTEILAMELVKDHDELDEHWAKTIALTAALHDIGKVGIPDAVLQKPGRLTDEERAIIQKHTTIGGDTLFAIKREWDDDTFLRTATEIAFAHHERWDGSGYPFGLAGEDIALSARIVAVADVYDALTSARVYKPAMPHEQARDLIVEGSGAHFDPAIVEVFLRVESQILAASRLLHDDPSSA